MKVFPRSFSGWSMSIAQTWGSGPKFTIVCGNCDLVFKKRILMVDNPGITCPHCGAVNIMQTKVERGG